MGHWIAALTCAVAAAFSTYGKGNNIPLASVLAGAAVVLTCVNRSAPKLSNEDSGQDHETSGKNTGEPANEEKVRSPTFKELHLKFNEDTKQAEQIEILRVPVEDEVVDLKVDSVTHIEICSKKHEDEIGSCTLSVLNNESHLNLSRGNGGFSSERAEVTIPATSVSNTEVRLKPSAVEQPLPGSNTSQVGENADEVTASIPTNKFEVKNSREENTGRPFSEPVNLESQSNVSKDVDGSKAGKREDEEVLNLKYSQATQSNADCKSDVTNETTGIKSHTSPSDTASSSTIQTTDIMMRTPERPLTSSESCASSFSFPSSEVYSSRKAEVSNTRSFSTGPQSPSISDVGSREGDDRTPESSPTASAQSARDPDVITDDKSRQEWISSRAAQEERLRSYDAYLADPTLSPSLKKQVLRARKIALQRLNLG